MEERKVLSLSFFLVITFASIELLGGFYTKSLSLLSDAGHMVTDSMALFISLIALKVASLKATSRMTYGLKRVEVLAGFINALLLIFLIGYIVYNALLRYYHPTPILAFPMFIIALLGLLINLIIIFLLSKPSHENLNIKSAYLHVLLDTLGSLSSLLASIIIFFTNYYFVDSIISLGLVLLILPQIYNLLKQSVEIFLQIAPSNISLKELETKIRKTPWVKDVHDVHLWSLTPKHYILTLHIVVKDLKDYEQAIEEVNKIAKEYGIKHTTIQIEKEDLPCPHKEDTLYF